jgi:hypothetical protein
MDGAGELLALEAVVPARTRASGRLGGDNGGAGDDELDERGLGVLVEQART